MSHSTELYELHALLKENYVHELFFTHVSLVQPKGRYSLSRSVLNRFWTLYCKIVRSGEACIGIAEAPQSYSSVLVDVDLKFLIPYNPPEDHLYSAEFVEALVRIYQDVLQTVVQELHPDQLTCVLLEKPKYSSAENQYKNGFHLHFPGLFLSRVDQEILVVPRVRRLMAENAHGILTFFEQFSSSLVGPPKISDLIDTGALKNAWLLYGSRKSEDQEPYSVSRVYDYMGRQVSLEEAFIDYPLYDEEEERILLVASNIEFHLPRILSICPFGRKVSEMRTDLACTPDLLQFIPKKVFHRPIEDERDEEAFEQELKVARAILPMLSVARADERNNWMTVGWALYNISRGSDEGLDLWLEFSKRSQKYNEARCIYEWSNMQDRRQITLGTLRFFAKADSPSAYQAFIHENSRLNATNISISHTHYDLAVLLHKQCGNEFVYTDSGWYRFHNHFWERIDNGFELRGKISTELVEFFNPIRNQFLDSMKDNSGEKELNKKLSEIDRLVACLKSTPFKNSVMAECKEVFYVRDFERKLNTNRYLLGFRNGVYDLEANYFRVGLPTDYISVQMPIEYKELEPSDARIKEVNQFFEKVFPDSALRRYFLDIASETFVGFNHRKHVYMWTGEGDNGKSITQMFFEKMYGKLSIKGPTTMITRPRVSAGAANAELSRVGNGVRTVFLEEPDKDEEIHTGVFKHLSGNDSLYTRDLYQAGKDVQEIIPMFKLFVICNELPKIKKGGDKATWNRIRVIPFESKFPKDRSEVPATVEEQFLRKIFPRDDDIEKRIPHLVEPFAWMLLQHRLLPKIDEPDKVKTATDRYRLTNDYLGQFMNAVIQEDQAGTVSSGDLYCRYKEWLDEGYPGNRPIPLSDFLEYFSKKWGNLDANGIWKGRRIKYTGTNDSVHNLL